MLISGKIQKTIIYLYLFVVSIIFIGIILSFENI